MKCIHRSKFNLKRPHSDVFRLFQIHHLNRFLLVVTVMAALLAGLTQMETIPLLAAPARQATEPATPLADAPVSTIQRIRKRGALVAGVKYDFRPFGFVDENGEIVGFDVDLVRAMADQWGVEVQFVPVTSSDRIQKLVAGEVDLVAASMTHKKERDELIDFSQTYFLDGQSLLVRRDSGIDDIFGLEGKTVAAIQGSTSIDQIQAHAKVNGVTLEILPFQEYPPALAALNAGQVDALTTDSVFLLQAAQENPDLAVVGERFTREPYGMGVRGGDSYFRNLVDFTLQGLKTSGVYDEIYARWFPDDDPYDIRVMPGAWPYDLESSPDAFEPPALSRMEEILSRGELLVGVKYDFAPFGFVNAEGDVVGFDVDIAREFAARWLGDPDAVELVRVTSDTRIPVLASGGIDLAIASMTHKQERDDLIDFSQTYFLDGQSLLVRVESDIQGLEDLDGKVVAAIDGSTSIDNIRAKAEKLGIRIEVLPFQEYPSALEALKAGQVDVLTTDSVALSRFAKDNPGLRLAGERFTQEPYGIGVPNYDGAFRDLVNFTLQEMAEDGSYDALYRKWSGDDQPYEIEIWPGESNLGVNIAARSPITSPVAAGDEPEETPVASPAVDASPTPAPTASRTLSPTAAPESTVTATPTLTPTTISTPTQTATPPPAPTSTPTPIATATPTVLVIQLPTVPPGPTPAPTLTPTLSPTATPEPTATATPTVTSTPPAHPPSASTAAPSATATVTPRSPIPAVTPIAAPAIQAPVGSSAYVVITVPGDHNVNARRAQSVESERLALLPQGSSIPAIGRSIDTAWLQVILPDSRLAWVFTETIIADADQLATLPVVAPPSLDESPSSP
jgi:polar amino acid transport system substrate-binding protein